MKIFKLNNLRRLEIRFKLKIQETSTLSGAYIKKLRIYTLISLSYDLVLTTSLGSLGYKKDLDLEVRKSNYKKIILKLN